MNKNNDYCIENRKDLIQKLKFQLEIYNIKYDISYENIGWFLKFDKLNRNNSLRID
jgi:hypothetical protein